MLKHPAPCQHNDTSRVSLIVLCASCSQVARSSKLIAQNGLYACKSYSEGDLVFTPRNQRWTSTAQHDAALGQGEYILVVPCSSAPSCPWKSKSLDIIRMKSSPLLCWRFGRDRSNDAFLLAWRAERLLDVSEQFIQPGAVESFGHELQRVSCA